jgi:flagellin
MVGSAALLVDDDIRINGVRVGTSLDSSAISKASTINLISEETGVVASAFTEAQITVNIANAAGATFTINGAAVTIGAAPRSMADVVSTINAAETGILASTDENGTLFLTSSGGADIKVAAANANFITDVKARSGEASVGAAIATGYTVKGRVSLMSDTGAEIRVEAESAASLVKLGMAAQGGSSILVGGALTITTQEAAGRALTKIDLAIERVLLSRATLGAFQNRLLAAVDNLSTTSLNLTQSRSRIMDADYASATTELARTQIVQQASTAMLAQANASQQSVLSLIQQ